MVITDEPTRKVDVEFQVVGGTEWVEVTLFRRQEDLGEWEALVLSLSPRQAAEVAYRITKKWPDIVEACGSDLF